MITPQNETSIVLALEESNWYAYSLACGHTVYSRVRLKYEKPHRQHHMIRCPTCDKEMSKRLTGSDKPTTAWQHISIITEVSDEHVSDVLSGTAFILPNRIMRLENHGGQGNPFPYTTRERDY